MESRNREWRKEEGTERETEAWGKEMERGIEGSEEILRNSGNVGAEQGVWGRIGRVSGGEGEGGKCGRRNWKV